MKKQRKARKEGIQMKKMIALVLVFVALTTTALAGGLLGGWQHSEDPAVTEDMQALFDKGLEGLVGVNYVPVAYLGSQVVAGSNHCFLAQAKVVAPNAAPAYVLVYLYEDLEGGVKLINIADFDIGAFCEYGAE